MDRRIFQEFGRRLRLKKAISGRLYPYFPLWYFWNKSFIMPSPKPNAGTSICVAPAWLAISKNSEAAGTITSALSGFNCSFSIRSVILIFFRLYYIFFKSPISSGFPIAVPERRNNLFMFPPEPIIWIAG